MGFFKELSLPKSTKFFLCFSYAHATKKKRWTEETQKWRLESFLCKQVSDPNYYLPHIQSPSSHLPNSREWANGLVKCRKSIVYMNNEKQLNLIIHPNVIKPTDLGPFEPISRSFLTRTRDVKPLIIRIISVWPNELSGLFPLKCLFKCQTFISSLLQSSLMRSNRECFWGSFYEEWEISHMFTTQQFPQWVGLCGDLVTQLTRVVAVVVKNCGAFIT